MRARTKTINQKDLTPDCWPVQIWGIGHCKTCEFLHTRECGGKNIRKAIMDGEFPMDGLPDQGGK